MIAAAYLRKSNDEGSKAADVKSTAVQLAEVRRFAESRGFTLDDRYVFSDDGISGAEFLNRPGLRALLASLEPVPSYQVLIVTEQSRLGRETLDTLLVIRQIETAGVELWSTDGRRITMADDHGELLAMLDSWPTRASAGRPGTVSGALRSSATSGRTCPVGRSTATATSARRSRVGRKSTSPRP